MKITRLGHACLIVQAGGARILIDPGNMSDFDDAGDLDAIIVTHNHADHFDPERALALIRRAGAPVYADPLTASKLAEEGVDAHVTTEGEDIVVGEVTITPVGSQHAFNHDDAPVIPNVGVVVRAEGEPSLFHPGDAYDAEPGDVDVLAVPLNAPWTPVRDTIAFIRRIKPRWAFPIHDGLLNDNGRTMYRGHAGKFGQAGEFLPLEPDAEAEF